MGNKYVRERPLEEIIQKLLTPQEEEQEEKKADATVTEDRAQNSPTPAIADPKASALSGKKASVSSLKDTKDKQNEKEKLANDPMTPNEIEEKEEAKEQPIKFLANDYLEKAEMSPPKDPYGSDTMHPNLIITADKLMNVVQ